MCAPSAYRKRDDALDIKKRKEADADDMIAREEEVYEKESRKVKEKPQAHVVDLLPFKAADGSLVYDKSRSSHALATVWSDNCPVRCVTLPNERGRATSSTHEKFPLILRYLHVMRL